MHEIIRLAKRGGLQSTLNEQASFEHNPSLEFDARGRLRRWVKQAQILEEERDKVCCGGSIDEQQQELRFVEKLEAYQSRLYVDLDVRTRALKNWKKLRLLILLLQVCGGRTAEALV